MRRLFAGAAVLGAFAGVGACLPGFAAEPGETGAPPGLDLSAPGVAWAGFVQPRQPNYAIARTLTISADPPNGIGPVTDDPAHPSPTTKWRGR